MSNRKIVRPIHKPKISDQTAIIDIVLFFQTTGTKWRQHTGQVIYYTKHSLGKETKYTKWNLNV